MAPKGKKQISVIVPARNEEDYIGPCIDSLLAQDINKSKYEIIVVDNASTDNTYEIARKKGVVVLKEPKKGYVCALIKGVDNAQGEILAFTDADCRVPRSWLNQFQEKFEQDPNLDAIGGVFEYFDGNILLQKIAIRSQKYIYHLSGGNSAIKRKSYDKFGGFDPKVNLGADTLLSFKIAKQGNMIINRKNVVATSSRRLSKAFTKTMIIWFTNDLSLKLFQKPLFSNFPDIRT